MVRNPVARVYAESLFSIARDRKSLEQTEQELDLLERVFKDEPKFKVFLESPNIDRGVKKQTVSRILSGKVSQIFLNFVLLLIDKYRVPACPHIHQHFKELLDIHHGLMRAQICTAAPVNGRLMSNLKAVLSEKYQKEIILESKVDQNILGGVVLRMGDVIVDGSVKTRLQQFRRKLVVKVNYGNQN